MFGHVRFADTLFLPLAVTGGDRGASALMTTAYQNADDRAIPMAIWIPGSSVFALMQVGGSAAWGLMPWLLWEQRQSGQPHVPGRLRHGGDLGPGGGARQQHDDVRRQPGAAFADDDGALRAGRFRPGLSSSPSPRRLFALQMWYTGRPLVPRMHEDARLRFKVEDLARELEETRDEALKKRFEAETANASKTAFLANMSHELRTPLNAILGFSEIIAQECFGPVGIAALQGLCRRHSFLRRASAVADQRSAGRRQDRGRPHGDLAPSAGCAPHLRYRAQADRHQGAREATRP